MQNPALFGETEIRHSFLRSWRLSFRRRCCWLIVSGSKKIALPEHTFILDHHGLARILSVPPDKDLYETEIVKSYRTAQGVLNNPKEDRRTTKGVFHVCEGGLPIANDKKAVPKIAFYNLLHAALNPPKELMTLPFTADTVGWLFFITSSIPDTSCKTRNEYKNYYKTSR